MRRLLLPLALAACAPSLPPASAQALAARAQPLTDDALTGLVALVGEARVLALGQPAPGSHELPRLLHRIFRRLSASAGFTGLALAADASAATRLDAYVQGAAVDLDAALLALGEPGLATAELRELLSWARERNAAGARPALRVFGLDPRDPEAAAALVLEYLERALPRYVAEARSLLADPRGVEVVLARLDRGRAAQIAASDPGAWAQARQQGELVAQALRMRESWEYEANEFARARNAEWALAQLGPGGKLLVWADNLGVAAEVMGPAPSMGDFLRQWLGADYRAIGVSFAGGSLVVTRPPQPPCIAPLAPPRPGSLDAALARAGLALIDLRGSVDPALRRPQRLRAGPGYPRLRPAIAFDAILNVPAVSPAQPLGAAIWGPCAP